MPDRQQGQTEDLLNQAFERIRNLERVKFDPDIPEIPEAPRSMYTWQSTVSLVTGLGHKLYTDRPGAIAWIRAERSAADGTSEAQLDLFLNGRSVFDGLAVPYATVPAGEALGPEIGFRVVYESEIKYTNEFQKGDWFQVEIVNTGGGSGPLRLSIHFENLRTSHPGDTPVP